LVGRIDVEGFPGNDFVGTGWFVDTNIVVTNRHVASLIARWDGRNFIFARGVAGKPMASSLNTLHEFDDIRVDESRVFAVQDVLYIEPDGGPDIAFLKVARRTDGSKPDRIPVARADVGDNVPVFVVGYPARAPKSVIPDQALMKELYRDRYDVKRAAPGYTMSPREGATRHDCTTLGGASGSPVLDLATGEAVGLHFAGLYQETNFAVRASQLAGYVQQKTLEPADRRRAPTDAAPKTQITDVAGRGGPHRRRNRRYREH
jgi:S1-C subfamily serine protease